MEAQVQECSSYVIHFSIWLKIIYPSNCIEFQINEWNCIKWFCHPVDEIPSVAASDRVSLCGIVTCIPKWRTEFSSRLGLGNNNKIRFQVENSSRPLWRLPFEQQEQLIKSSVSSVVWECGGRALVNYRFHGTETQFTRETIQGRDAGAVNNNTRWVWPREID